jgi:hypothetical protein
MKSKSELNMEIEDLTKQLNLKIIELDAYKTLRSTLLKQHQINCDKLEKANKILDEPLNFADCSCYVKRDRRLREALTP